MSIQEVWGKINRKVQEKPQFYSDLLTICIVIVVGVGGFTLGRMSVIENQEGEKSAGIMVHETDLGAVPLEAFNKDGGERIE